MQFNQLIIFISCFITLITAFSNTAPLLIDTKYDISKIIPSTNHIIHNRKIDQNLPMIYATNNFKDEVNFNRNNKIDKTDDIVYYQVSLNDWNNIEDKSFIELNDYLYMKNVFYKDESHVNMIQFRIINVEPEQLDSESLSQVISTIKNKNSFPKDFIIQVIPDFITTESSHDNKIEEVEEKIINLFNNDEVVVKKDEEDVEDIKVQQEIESDFAEANRLAEQEDQLVSIMEGGDLSDDAPQNSTTYKHDNLFTNYQFFTSGIWSGLIVSGFLLAILYGALSWLTTLEITYASFEKPVDFDKKNE
ncbi:hypothetical protein KGF54_003165 [Candida jiufengensis]|uniref:uncharacterized protein n=1 Tax=Candida jiufengensis TaxID=497108 RepID=UPI002225584C|nr:uncharacterized protein KGF54_003165 [Candida jiufengensis]KAI5952299.1 hypothetical protein KGF54_003165 [Candida jiufengensis]